MHSNNTERRDKRSLKFFKEQKTTLTESISYLLRLQMQERITAGLNWTKRVNVNAQSITRPLLIGDAYRFNWDIKSL